MNNEEVQLAAEAAALMNQMDSEMIAAEQAQARAEAEAAVREEPRREPRTARRTGTRLEGDSDYSEEDAISVEDITIVENPVMQPGTKVVITGITHDVTAGVPESAIGHIHIIVSENLSEKFGGNNVFRVRISNDGSDREWVIHENDLRIVSDEDIARIEQERKLRKSRVESYQEALEPVLEGIWPGNWSMREAAVPEVNDRNRGLEVLIRFPEIEILNAQGRSKTIRDLFVRFFIRYNGQLRFFQGTRMSVFPEEYRAGYQHSHLPSSTQLGRFQRFCTGSTAVSTTVAELSSASSFNIDAIELLLHQINPYVRWESLAGGPHIRMENVTQGSGRVREPGRDDHIRILNVLLEQGMLSEVPLVFKKYSTHSEYQVDEDKLADFMNSSSRIKDWVSAGYRRLIVSQLPDGTIVPAGTTPESISRDLAGYAQNLRNDGRAVIFRGEEVVPQVISNIDSSVSESVTIIHPKITKGIAGELQKRINNYYLNSQ